MLPVMPEIEIFEKSFLSLPVLTSSSICTTAYSRIDMDYPHARVADFQLEVFVRSNNRRWEVSIQTVRNIWRAPSMSAWQVWLHSKVAAKTAYVITVFTGNLSVSLDG